LSQALTDEDVLAIRRWWDNGGTRAEIADAFELSGTGVHKIVYRHNYKHLPGGVMFVQLQLPGFCRNGHPRIMDPGREERVIKGDLKGCYICYQVRMRNLAAARLKERHARMRKKGRSPFDSTKNKVSRILLSTETVWLPGIWVQGRLF
jgi:hypothetical protein